MSGRAAGWLLAAVLAASFLYLLGFVGDVADGRALVRSYAWAPTLGIALSFALDGLSLPFALLITGVGALVVVYANGYLDGHPYLLRFHALLALFAASMLGLVLADDLITLFVCWELTSISSYFLIGFEHDRESARASALQALLVTSAGGLALLAAFLLLRQVGGSFELSALLQDGDAVRAHALYVPIVLLVLAGAFTKSAQVPFHFWLPGAMAAPTPVSAYLHSATMVKAGVYLLARLTPILGGTDLWFVSLTTVGAVTMVVGAVLSLRETDLKLVLAQLTVSALGILVLFVGLGTPAALLAALVFLLAHALYKGALFLVVGIVDHEAGTRDVERLGALRTAMPLTTAIALLAGASLAALPPTLGFVGKEALLDVSLGGPGAATLRSAALVLASTIFVAAAGIVALQPFFGRAPADEAAEAHEASPTLWLGPLVLAALGVLFGVWPALVDEALVRPAAHAVVRQPIAGRLSSWPGLHLALALSAASVVCGVVLYALRDRVRSATTRLRIDAAWGPQRWYGRIFAGVMRLAELQTRLLQNGYLRAYLMVIVATTVLLAGGALLLDGDVADVVPKFDLAFHEWVVAALIPTGAVAAITARSRLAAVAALGVVGYGVGLIFVLFGAPDLAMTQFMVETLTVILLVLVFYHLRRFAVLSSWSALLRDAVVASAFGVLVTVIVFVGSAIQLAPKISSYFVEHSVDLAHGRNVVNTLLVDFRAFDTLGEITVLSVAGAGVYALLKLRPRGEQKR
ncbi:MAG TPA: putative monovalent cation/H+ antiporter subunit A [Candidatus Binatia bacterium]